MFTEAVISGLTEALAGTLAKAGGRRLRGILAKPDRKQAFERCCEAGIVALLRASGSDNETQVEHVGEIVRSFFTSKDIAGDLGTALAPLLRGQPIDMSEMRELFEDAGYDAATLPDFDFDAAFTDFAGGFVAAAVKQEELRGEIETQALLSILERQTQTLDEVRRLASFLLQARPGSAAVSAGQITAQTVAGTQIIFNPAHASGVPGTGEDSEERRLRDSYLGRVFQTAGALALSGVDPAVAGSEADASLRLDAVYTALLTQTPQDPRHLEGGQTRSRRPSSALDQLGAHDRLVLLGDPGSGKSTFANFVALCLAGELLGEQQANLELLTAPLPGAEDEPQSDDETKPTWDHGGLLPVPVVLRDFAARGLPGKGETGTAEGLWRFLEGELQRAELGDYAPYLKQTLLSDGGLILLDGLDEVPEAEGRRRQILDAVEDFAATFRRCRFLVTCRTYAYQHQKWRLPDFEEAILEPLNEAQIRHFVDRWYAHVAELRRLEAADAQGRAELLKSAIFGSDRLRPLAERPLLLTLMASLHAWRGGSLPDRREELYHDAVQLLLDFWEQRRVVRDRSGKPLVQQESLAEWLRVDRERMRRLLNEIAFDAHKSQPDLAGTADVAEENLVNRLLKLAGNPDLKPARLVEYLRDRAGLFLARGVGIYTFPHRTFQEYLAACHLTEHQDFPNVLAELARGDKERWREVTLLAAAKSARGAAASRWHLADALCFRQPGDEKRGEGDAHGAHLAGLVLAEGGEHAHLGERLRRQLDRVRAWQVDLLTGSELPARDRAECGRTVAGLEDPRPEVLEVEAMQLCWVPPGPFRMGTEADSDASYFLLPESPPSDIDVPYGFWIGQFPVTQAQYRAFVEDGGYGEAQYWPEAIKTETWREARIEVFEWSGRGTVRASRPQSFAEPFRLSNHPLVGVSWFEARAFCRWLTGRMRKEGKLSEGWKVDLPNEPEWEKAARGGLRVPREPVMAAARDFGTAEPRSELSDNPAARRLYPWGDKINAEHANWRETGIGTTSAVGCFPSGRSPVGCEEMGGNVWEWTRSQRGDYPYPETAEDRAKRESFEKGAAGFVLRGGGFGDGGGNVRCAARGAGDPSHRDVYVGFRVVLSPSGL